MTDTESPVEVPTAQAVLEHLIGSLVEDREAVRIDNDKALGWLRKGAQPTESVRKLLEISGAWEEFSGEPRTRPVLTPADEKPAPAAEPAKAAPKAEAPKAAEAKAEAPAEGAE